MRFELQEVMVNHVGVVEVLGSSSRCPEIPARSPHPWGLEEKACSQAGRQLVSQRQSAGHWGGHDWEDSRGGMDTKWRLDT